MAKLHRPYIPLKVRAQVAERQFFEATGCHCTNALGVRLIDSGASFSERLGAALAHLSKFGTVKLQLHHRPALCNRRQYKRGGRIVYDPHANDPAHLFYLPHDDHGIETRVRGIGAQRSDLGQRRYLKNVEKARAKRRGGRRRVKKVRVGGWQGGKREWPSRPFLKRSKGQSR